MTAMLGARALVAATLAILMLAGCVEVKPWERGTLAHPAMNPKPACRLLGEEFLRHCFDVREGATGGGGHVGGGCGCN